MITPFLAEHHSTANVCCFVEVSFCFSTLVGKHCARLQQRPVLGLVLATLLTNHSLVVLVLDDSGRVVGRQDGHERVAVVRIGDLRASRVLGVQG